MYRNRFQTGFTLLELLVVIAIIGILSSIVIVSLSDSRAEARNAQVLSQMLEYEKALNLYFAENGVYPGAPTEAARRTERCLDAAGGCWSGASSNDLYVQSALLPDYMAEAPGFVQGPVGSPAYNGCTNNDFNDIVSCSDTEFAMFYLLEGLNQECVRDHLEFSGFLTSDGDYTLCIMNLGN